MNRFVVTLASLAALAMAFVPGCGSDAGTSCEDNQVDCDGTCIDAIPATLQGVSTQVFEKSCAYSTCHDADSPAAGLSVHDMDAIIAAIDSPSGQDPNVMQIAPGDSANSYIYRKMVGENMAATDVNGNAATIMPPGSPLCAPKVEAVRAWIDAGAPTE
ncbi:MAG: hypothetical protein HOI23_22660 [Deltaproteobacteria bacterium]|jgi:hypothetical protein|nr:hypothetical protein [Deltaproteobacteria bacterium]MBT6432767.1 hypothetical protein [Deltaproteobacteria bacterium]